MKNYIPAPVNTGDITLDSGVLNLIEKIAENVHEVWALGRKNEGWVYGETKDSEAKTTPCLVPYDELPESEKEYDRATATETIKLIKKFGYYISDVDPASISLSLAKAYNDLGDLYRAQNQNDKAEPMYIKSLEIKECIAENNSAELISDLILSCNNAGVFFKDQGQTQKAEAMFVKAFDICRKHKQRKDFGPDLATTYFNYGIFHEKTEYLDKALEIARTQPDHPLCKAIIDLYGNK